MIPHAACLFDKLDVPTAGTKYRKLFGWLSGCMCYSMGCTFCTSIKPLAFCDNLLIPKGGSNGTTHGAERAPNALNSF